MSGKWSFRSGSRGARRASLITAPSTTTQQVANGPGASNQGDTASVNGHGLAHIDQADTTVNFANVW
ncbi:hypothetical protein [Streptomyces paromomycinus]|uniref:hypothetical protein n=1 Tax=Streptomyces paromomycinus TaxID=92743 RepID=UPI000F616885|nr:hypothetical protein [Streptomyces paromomycinus]